MILLELLGAFLYCQFLAWSSHKYLFHGRRWGKRRDSWLRHHWQMHHPNCRRAGNFDENVHKGILHRGNYPEPLILSLMALLHLPLAWALPVAYAALVVYAVTYYCVHRAVHTWPRWGARWFPWHYAHHMGRNQDSNWCVVLPCMDWFLGTREKMTKEERDAALRSAPGSV